MINSVQKYPRPLNVPKYFAHRGDCAAYPENSLEALCAAQSLGAAVEFDVRRCLDELVVFHDPDLSRMCGHQILLDECRWDQLKVIPLESQNQIFIPLLSQVLECCSGKTLMNIELKQKKLSEEVVALLEQMINSKRAAWTDYLISSFEYEVLADIRQKSREVPLAILTRDDPEHEFMRAHDIQACAIHMNINRADFRIVQACREQGFLVGLYPVDDQSHIELAQKYRADYIFCRHPDLGSQFKPFA